MIWISITFVVLFTLGVMLAFPLAIGISVALGVLLMGLDYITRHLPGLRHLRLLYLRRKYRPGKIVSHFIAKDVIRNVKVIDASAIDKGYIRAQIQTTNLLYERIGVVPESTYGPPGEFNIDELWEWTGQSWGGLPDGTSIAQHIDPIVNHEGIGGLSICTLNGES